MEEVIFLEEQRAHPMARVEIMTLGTGMALPTILTHGRPEHLAAFGQATISGDVIWCQLFSEPGAGSDLAGIRTTGVRDGDGWIINGQKVWTSGAFFADWGLLLARTDPNVPKHKGISYLLVNMHSPGVTVKPLVQMTGARGFNEVFFEDVRVPRENLVGERNQGWQVAMTTLAFERSSIGSSSARDTSAAVRELAALARRLPCGDGSTAWDDANVRQQIASFACQAAALRYTNLRQLTRRLKGLPPGPEGSGAKLVVSDLILHMAKFAMELLGPFSQFEQGAPFALDEGKWSYRMLGSRVMTIAGGTSEIQRNIIGERVLRLPKG